MARRWLAILALALLPLAFAPLVGLWAAGASALLLVLVAGQVLPGLAGWRSDGVGWAALVPGLALLGGLVGAASAIAALVAVGGEVPYRERVGLGWAALALAAIAGASGLLVGHRPIAGATVMVAAGLLGAAAITVFSINSYYVLAVPLWLSAAVAALIRRRSPL